MKHLQTLIPGRFLSTTVLLVIGNILVDTFMLMQKTGNV